MLSLFLFDTKVESHHTSLKTRNTAIHNGNKLRMKYNNLLIEKREQVGLIRLNRPAVLNALNGELMDELGAALMAFERDSEIRAMVITGSERAFAAGAEDRKSTRLN